MSILNWVNEIRNVDANNTNSNKVGKVASPLNETKSVFQGALNNINKGKKIKDLSKEQM